MFYKRTASTYYSGLTFLAKKRNYSCLVLSWHCILLRLPSDFYAKAFSKAIHLLIKLFLKNNNMHAKNILVIEDNRDIANLVIVNLRGKHMQVDHV